MFITLDNNFYPLESTLKEHILNYSYLLDRSICSWKTRGRLRIRTGRKITDKQRTRKFYRLQIWKEKQYKLIYRVYGYLYGCRDFLYSNLLFLLFVTFFEYIKRSTFFLFFCRPCFIRRLLRKKYVFLTT